MPPVLLNRPDQFKSQPHRNILAIEGENDLTAHAAFVYAFDFSLHILQRTGDDSNLIAFFGTVKSYAQIRQRHL